MQESVRRIIEAEEARMGKDYCIIYLFYKFGEKKGQCKGVVSSFPLLMKRSVAAAAHVVGEPHYDSAPGT